MQKVHDAIDALGADVLEKFERLEAKTKAQDEKIERMEAEGGRLIASGDRRDTAEHTQFRDFARTGSGLQRKDVSSSSGSGALIPSLVGAEIVNKALALSRLGSAVRRTQVNSGDYQRVLRSGYTSAAWSSETGTRSASTDAEFRAITPTHGELYAYCSYTNWLLADSRFDIARELQGEIVAQFARTLETAIVSGNGSSRPTGMLASNPTSSSDGASPQRAAGVYQYVASGQAGGLNHLPGSSPQRYGDDALLNLFFTLKPEYRAKATWLMASTTLAAVRKFKDTTGQPIWQPNMAAGVDQGDGFLFGKPVIVSEAMPAVGSNAFAIGVGDLQQGYELVEIHGLEITRDDVTTPGKTKFYVRARFGGHPLDNDAIKFMKCSAS